MLFRSVSDFLTRYPDYESLAQALIAGTLPIDLFGVNPDGWSIQGTALNKANLLAAAVTSALGMTDATATVSGALQTLKGKIDTAQSTANTAQTKANAALPKSGGTMTGLINHGGYRATNLGTPSSSTDGATKGYVDTATNNAVAPFTKMQIYALAPSYSEDRGIWLVCFPGFAFIPWWGGNRGKIELPGITKTTAPAWYFFRINEGSSGGLENYSVQQTNSYRNSEGPIFTSNAYGSYLNFLFWSPAILPTQQDVITTEHNHKLQRIYPA